MALDEGSSGGPQTVFQDRTDEGQELPASAASTFGVVIGGTGSGSNRMSECF